MASGESYRVRCVQWECQHRWVLIQSQSHQLGPTHIGEQVTILKNWVGSTMDDESTDDRATAPPVAVLKIWAAQDELS